MSKREGCQFLDVWSFFKSKNGSMIVKSFFLVEHDKVKRDYQVIFKKDSNIVVMLSYMSLLAT